MSNVIRSHIMLNNISANAISSPQTIEAFQSSVVAQISGTGALSAVINVYTGVWDPVAQNWAIRTLDSTITLTGTDLASGRVNLTTIARTAQIEVVGLTGTNAKISVALIQTNGNVNKSSTIDSILFNKVTATIPTQSKVVRTAAIESAIIAQITGTGAVGGTLNVYGGVYSESEGVWMIKVLDGSYPISGTTTAILKQNLSLISRHIQFEITGLTGTSAAITAALINSEA